MERVLNIEDDGRRRLPVFLLGLEELLPPPVVRETLHIRLEGLWRCWQTTELHLVQVDRVHAWKARVLGLGARLELSLRIVRVGAPDPLGGETREVRAIPSRETRAVELVHFTHDI